MTKEIHDINTRALDFVVELIDYIFEYPDDDYMTMECLCRKLIKHGLLDKVDGYYQTHEIRTNTHECVKDTHDKTENNSEKPNNCEICKHWEYDAKYKWWHCPLQDNGIYECHYEPRKLTAVEDEPTISKMEQVDEPIDRDDLGNCNICKYVGLEHRCNQCVNGSMFCKVEDEPQTEGNK